MVQAVCIAGDSLGCLVSALCAPGADGSREHNVLGSQVLPRPNGISRGLSGPVGATRSEDLKIPCQEPPLRLRRRFLFVVPAWWKGYHRRDWGLLLISKKLFLAPCRPGVLRLPNWPVEFSDAFGLYVAVTVS